MELFGQQNIGAAFFLWARESFFLGCDDVSHWILESSDFTDICRHTILYGDYRDDRN